MLWVSLPFTLGPALAEALSTRNELVQRVDSSGSWLLWLAGLISTFVVSSASLTANRVLAPAALVVAVAAVVGGAGGAVAAMGIGVGALTLLTAFNHVVADCYVNGSSYGDEQRFLLRTPAALLLGPLELTIAVIIAGAVAGPMLVAAGAWIAGTVALVVGWPLAAVAIRALHGLSRRWLVFVPVGMVLHDYSVLIDSMLLVRKDVASIGWATTDTDALDLTANGLGRVIEITLTERGSVLMRPPRRPGRDGPAVEPRETGAILVSPTRGRAVLAEAASRRLPVTP